jgi:hypothetical protein
MAKRRGNPNWGKAASYTIPVEPSSFESLVKKLKLSPEQYEGSGLLKGWALRHKDSKYVPQELLEAWKFPEKY